MPYETLFSRGIHVVTTGLSSPSRWPSLGPLPWRSTSPATSSTPTSLFGQGEELWGGDGNRTARLLAGADVGIIGLAISGRALNRLLSGFRTRTQVFDPWLPPSILIDSGVEPASLDTVLSTSDYVFVVASVTSENQGFLGTGALARMRKGSGLHPAQPRRRRRFSGADGCGSQRPHRRRQRRCFPEEPLAQDHPCLAPPCPVSCARRTGPARSTSPSSAWATWCWDMDH